MRVAAAFIAVYSLGFLGLSSMMDSATWRFVMPIVVVLLILMFVTTATRSYLLNNLLSMVGMILLILIVLDGVLSGRRVSRFVRERHPDTALSTWSMGFYAFSRASMIRRFRTPRPQVNIGDSI